MSNSRWDDDAWRRRGSPRDGHAPEADRSHSRAPHGSSHGWDDGSGGRGGANGSGREREHARGYDRDGRDGASSRGGWDDGRPGSAGRRGGGGAGGGGGGYERSSSRGRSPGREDYPGAGERSMRGPRPSSRDDGYGSPRHRPRPDGSPGASSSRGRPPERGGGLWGDDGTRSRRPGPGGGPGARGARLDPRDPRMARRPLGAVPAEEDDEDESSFGLGKALLAIVMMFALGAVAGFGYFRLSTPTVHSDSNNQQQNATPLPSASPSTTPSTTPSATGTPHAMAPASSGPALAYVLVTQPMV